MKTEYATRLKPMSAMNGSYAPCEKRSDPKCSKQTSHPTNVCFHCRKISCVDCGKKLTPKAMKPKNRCAVCHKTREVKADRAGL